MTRDMETGKVEERSGIGFLNLLRQDFINRNLGGEIQNILLSAGMSIEEFLERIQNKDVFENSVQAFSDIILNSFHPSYDVKTSEYRFCIDYSRDAESTSELELTQYIDEERQCNAKKIITVKTADIRVGMSVKTIKNVLMQDGFYLARIHELVSFQKAFPIDRKFHTKCILALGEFTIIDGRRSYLFEDLQASLKPLMLEECECVPKGTKILLVKM